MKFQFSCALLVLAAIFPVIEFTIPSRAADHLRPPSTQSDPDTYGRGVYKNYTQVMVRRAAEKGDPRAMFEIGLAYDRGDGVPINYDQALIWYRKAADLGDATAITNIGYLYYMGRGVHKDYTEATRWFRIAAEKGEVMGMHDLAGSYFHGEGAPLDYGQAVSWYQKAADRGNVASMTSVVHCYLNGLGVPRDLYIAIQWARKATAAGGADGAKFLQENRWWIAFSFMRWFEIVGFGIGILALILGIKAFTPSGLRLRKSMRLDGDRGLVFGVIAMVLGIFLVLDPMIAVVRLATMN